MTSQRPGRTGREPVPDGNGWASGVAPYDFDPADAGRPWEGSLRLMS